jgi:hypothetical protein
MEKKTNKKAGVVCTLMVGVLGGMAAPIRAQTIEQSALQGEQSFAQSPLAVAERVRALAAETITDVKVSDLLGAQKNHYLEKTVRVEGKVKLVVGENYTRFFYLYDDEGKNRILLHPWLPASSMREILDRPATITARFLKPTWISLPYLDVESCDIRAAAQTTASDAQGWNRVVETAKDKGERMLLAPEIMVFTLAHKKQEGDKVTDDSFSVILSPAQTSVDVDVTETLLGQDGLLNMRQRIYNSDDKGTLLKAHEGIIIGRKDSRTGNLNVLKSSSKDLDPTEPNVLTDWKHAVLEWTSASPE